MTDNDLFRRYRSAHARTGWAEAQAYYGVRAPITAPLPALTALMEAVLADRSLRAHLLTLDGPKADPAAGVTLVLGDSLYLFNMGDCGPDGDTLIDNEGRPVSVAWVHDALGRRETLLALGRDHGIDLSALLDARPGHFFHSNLHEPASLWLGQCSCRGRALKLKMVQRALEDAGFSTEPKWGGTIFGVRLAALEEPGTIDCDITAEGAALQPRLADFYATKGGQRLHAGLWMDDVRLYVIAP